MQNAKTLVAVCNTIGWELLVEIERGLPRIRGFVKWFDPGKGFGFIVAEDGSPDILLHVNALRNFGQSSVADRAGIEVSVQKTERGLQAVEIFDISPPLANPDEPEDLAPAGFEPEILALPLEPARIKWFDKGKGFGFANVFGRPEDVFVHMEVLRRSGFAELQPGEGVGLRIVEGERGRMAVMIAAWDTVLRTGR
jgi:CspA family cold shock protein